MIGLAGSLTFLVAGLFSPVAGFLVDKFNIRILMIIGCIILGCGLLLHSQAMTPGIVYLSRSLMGVSLGLS
jgi:MFS family permease